MPLRLTELRGDEPLIEIPDRYLLLIDGRVEQVAKESDVREAIQTIFDLADTLTSVARKQVFENDAGDLVEIEQADEPAIMCARLVE